MWAWMKVSGLALLRAGPRVGQDGDQEAGRNPGRPCVRPEQDVVQPGYVKVRPVFGPCWGRRASPCAELALLCGQERAV